MGSPKVRWLKKKLKLDKYEARMKQKALDEAVSEHIEETFKIDLDARRKEGEEGVELEVNVGPEPEEGVKFDVVEGEEPEELEITKVIKRKKPASKKKTSTKKSPAKKA